MSVFEVVLQVLGLAAEKESHNRDSTPSSRSSRKPSSTSSASLAATRGADEETRASHASQRDSANPGSIPAARARNHKKHNHARRYSTSFKEPTIHSHVHYVTLRYVTLRYVTLRYVCLIYFHVNMMCYELSEALM